MFGDSAASSLTLHGNLKWLWLLVAAATVLLSFKSYFVLQLLAALGLFTLVFAILAVLAAAFASLVIAADRLVQWTVDSLTPIAHSTHARPL
jgi:hypothetical protein